MKLIILTGCVAISIVGCAKKPESIAPAYVSDYQFQSLTCPQLQQEQARLDSAYTTAADQQNHARTNDTVGVILLGLPVSTLSGDNVAAQIAQLKGQKEAIGRVRVAKGC